MASAKKTVRDAVLTLLAGMTDVKTLAVYGAEIVHDAQLPAVFVSTAVDVPDSGGSNAVLALNVTVALRIVAKMDADRDNTVNVVDRIEAIEEQIMTRLAQGPGAAPPLGVNEHAVYFDNTEEPEVDDEHETPVAIVVMTYGVIMRVDRAAPSTIV